MTDEAPMQSAWNAWRASRDGQDAIAALRNPAEVGHLYLAFCAGWEAKKRADGG